MSSARASRGRLLVPILILALAAFLRFWGIDQGLPFPNARPDEREALEHTVGFRAGDLNPHWFVYPNLFFWLVWGWEEMALAVRRLFLATPSYPELLAGGLPALILNGRLLSAALGTATVGLVYALGRRLNGPALGALAALLVAVNLLHVRDSHALKADVFLAAGVPVCLWLVARWVQAGGRWRHATAAGLAIGLTTALKYPGILLLGSVYQAGVMTSPHTGVRRFVPGPPTLLIASIAVSTFLAASPYLILDFANARRTAAFSVLAIYASRPERPAPPARFETLERVRRFFTSRTFGYHVGVSLRHGAGLLFSLLVPFALAAAWWPPRHPFLVLAASFSLLYYAMVGISPVHQSRYMTPLVPLLALLVARLVFLVSARIPRPAAGSAVAALLALALLAEPAVSSMRYDRIIARTDTRVLATRWMAAHLPAGAMVAELGSVVFPIADPELPPGIARATLPFGATDLGSRGVTHVVTHEHQLPFSTLSAPQMLALKPRLRLLAEFSPYRDGPAGWFEVEDAYYVPFHGFDGVERSGPLVRIYAYDAAP